MNEGDNLQSILMGFDIERVAFEALLAQIPYSSRDTHKIHDDWTVKDILAHISAWERELLRWLNMAKEGDQPDIPAPEDWGNYIAQFNDRAYLQNRDRPLADVEREFKKDYARLREVMESLPDAPDDPIWSLWQGESPPWQLLAEFHIHYEDHATSIRNWFATAQTTIETGQS